MKNILILYSHWPPSNLAGVHRARLISNFLHDLNWNPIVLTVHEDYYKEKLDQDIVKTVNPKTEVIKVKAKEVNSSGRFIGDITLRAYSNLKEEAIKIIKDRKIDFLWAPIPSFYSAILARKIHNVTGVPYGIDYIDPWVDSFVGQQKLFSKAWISNQVAKFMEPYSVKKAALISGVSTSYYQGVLDRNFKNKKIAHVGMPYGFDPSDHKIIIDNIQYPWKEEEEVYIYAGALLPKSTYFLDLFFRQIKELKQNGKWKDNKKLYFVGTISSTSKSISDYAQEYEISDTVIEIKARFPFLHILNFLNKAKGVMVFGTTESHYTASKIFQSLLSEKPIFGVFHHESSVVKILKECQAENYLTEYSENEDQAEFENRFKKNIELFFNAEELHWNPNLNNLDPYSAKESAKKLVEEIELTLQQ